MDSLVAAVRHFADDEDGITAIEYGLIAALMAVAVSVGFGTIKTALEAAMTFVQGKLSTAAT